MRKAWMTIAVSASVVVGCAPEGSAGGGEAAGASAGGGEIPIYEAEAWPQVPNDWVLGLASGLATDTENHIWIIHRPRTIPDEDQGRAAPAVLEFDADGTYVQGWGRGGVPRLERVRVAQQRARDRRGPGRLRLDRGKRRWGRPDPQVHP